MKAELIIYATGREYRDYVSLKTKRFNYDSKSEARLAASTFFRLKGLKIVFKQTYHTSINLYDIFIANKVSVPYNRVGRISIR